MLIVLSQLVSKSHLLTAIQTTLLNALTPAVGPPSAGSASGSGSSTPNPTPALAQTPPQLLTRSHNIHSELLLTLSPNNNITESIRRHGLSDQTTSLVVVRMGPGPAHAEDQGGPDGEGQGQGSRQVVWKEIEEVVKGRLVELDQLDREDHPDWPRVDKVGSGWVGVQKDRVGLGRLPSGIEWARPR